ncbi:hypothetical protein HK102_000269 [Quaeritorhiza haematococci]|nr:hypothetical protein HK102_000269 [Quaeritorhiza haematococci]
MLLVLNSGASIHVKPGYEILRQLIKRPNLQDNIMMQLINILKIPVGEIESELVEDRRNWQKPSDENGKGASNLLQSLLSSSGQKAELSKPSETLTSTYVQQAYAAKLLGLMAATSNDLALRMIQLQVVSGLLNTIGNVGHLDSQRYAANTLIYLVENYRFVAQALRENMGRSFVELIERKPDTFYKELTREQVRFLRRNAVNIQTNVTTIPTLQSYTTESDSESEPDLAASNARSLKDSTAGKNDSLAEKNAKDIAAKSSYSLKSAAEFPTVGDDGASSNDSSRLQSAQKQDKSAKPNSKSTAESDTKTNEENVEKPPVRDMYVPFMNVSIMSTFAGNKYGTSAQQDLKDKFQKELEKFREFNSTRTVKDVSGKKEEFNLQLHPETEAKMQNLIKDPDLFNKDFKVNAPGIPTESPQTKNDTAPQPEVLETIVKTQPVPEIATLSAIPSMASMADATRPHTAPPPATVETTGTTSAATGAAPVVQQEVVGTPQDSSAAEKEKSEAGGGASVAVRGDSVSDSKEVDANPPRPSAVNDNASPGNASGEIKAEN